MDESKISKKDQIILQQLDVIRTMTENNMSRMGTDFWGNQIQPLNVGKTEKSDQKDKETFEINKPDTPAGYTGNSAASTGNDDTDAPKTEEAPPEKIEDLQSELDSYIGLTAIKKEVKNLINMVTVYKLRRDNNLPTTDLSLHMVFSGNPGTGKTTVARLMARIYHSLGILSKGQLVEVDRSGLVAGYVGQTAIKTSKVIDSAIGGVLFIDEAYALNGRAENDFGQEAIDTILKAMEDHRDDLVVIVAGYDGLMDDFVHSNPGLESRFNRFLHFDDYNVDEMMQIFKSQCKKGCYTLDDAAEKEVREFIQVSNTNSISFGNARGVRNIFEQVLVNQANRLAVQEQVSREDLMKIALSDVRMAEGKPSEAPPVADEASRLRGSGVISAPEGSGNHIAPTVLSAEADEIEKAADQTAADKTEKKPAAKPKKKPTEKKGEETR
ncbi:MAG: AAA family ATPase [Oscillibacter sp.]|jgi:SpoVK/Ycf46/Vps4 family AAA+-type ATPase|nr:AAA family ATPase [Oscillibacter sp.]